MAEKSSFFNSVDGDRKYKAEDMAAHFAKVLTNGVMPAGTQLQALEDSGMNVVVSAGSAWINGYAYHNDSNFTLTIDPADGALNRIDRIVVRWSRLDRAINLAVLKGIPASSLAAPAIVRNADYYDLSIATVSVGKGISGVTQAMITDTRMDSSVCGFVSSLIQPDTSGWFAQFEAVFNNMLTGNQTDWDTWYASADTAFNNAMVANQAAWDAWFATIQGALGGDTAGNLLNRIESLTADDVGAAAADHTHTLEALGAQAAITASGILKGTGSAVQAAERGTDYSLVNAPVIVSVPYTGWVKNATTNAYEQSVAVAGLLATDDKRTRVEIVGSTDVAAQALIDTAAGLLSYLACNANGQLYMRCDSGAPATTFSVAVIIAR